MRMPVHEDGVPLAMLLSDDLQPLKEQREQDEAASDPPSSPREISETLHDPQGGTGVAGQQGNLQQSDKRQQMKKQQVCIILEALKSLRWRTTS